MSIEMATGDAALGWIEWPNVKCEDLTPPLEHFYSCSQALPGNTLPEALPRESAEQVTKQSFVELCSQAEPGNEKKF